MRLADSLVHFSVSGNKSLSQAFRRRKSNDDILSASVQEELRVVEAPVKNLPSGSQSWSTPTSPYYQGSRNLFVRITSPVVCAKLQTFPKAKMRLPPKVSTDCTHEHIAYEGIRHKRYSPIHFYFILFLCSVVCKFNLSSIAFQFFFSHVVAYSVFHFSTTRLSDFVLRHSHERIWHFHLQSHLFVV